ncbi:helix-turn-helix domain-containing protein [Vibrio hippocampi]|uniref:HTH-type transcriptional activator RhaS n=1 Tax=Vibrio hippocampi TaxID=654686 RepID=A0ABN8DLT1_9VIBR|nr:helix-turn-helix domain-containing protein [Vibrio hippocampi]CAH0530430.1 HTH-type transcriptional activator RhaS [Vibrio hippocampi]
MTERLHIDTISTLHKSLGLGRPLHPLVSVIHQKEVSAKVYGQAANLTFGVYLLSLKDGASCTFGYGQTTYDFDDGTMTFISPNQEVRVESIESPANSIGWTIAIHPDLIRKTDLGVKIDQYTFFNYESNEALHLSEREIAMVSDIARNIEVECDQNMDSHTQSLICSNIELLLRYCSRFYDRQFMVRANLNDEYINKLNHFLHQYYQSDKPTERGIPSVQYCGQQLGLSPYYLSDLLKQQTGKNALEHIHLFLIEKAKGQMLSSKQSITQIAYDLGFEYPQHFSKLFKAKVGVTPREYRTKH